MKFHTKVFWGTALVTEKIGAPKNICQVKCENEYDKYEEDHRSWLREWTLLINKDNDTVFTKWKKKKKNWNRNLTVYGEWWPVLITGILIAMEEMKAFR